MDSVEELIKQELGTATLKRTRRGGSGCINEGAEYITDSGNVFIKFNNKSEASQLEMFEGEFASLAALKATATVKVPSPIKMIKNPNGGAMLVMDYIDFRGLSSMASKLGEQIARLHLSNIELLKQAKRSEQSIHVRPDLVYVEKFGFPCATCCGIIPQENEWMDSWVDFFARKIEQHVRLAEKKYNDREVGAVWAALVPNLYKLFKDIKVEPALLHGDLWGGNAGETDEEPVVFDPASFYGHSEYDLAISKMFGGFGKAYFSSYHRLLPKTPGFEDRQDLYKMFHYLNHWNHFGGGYKESSINLMRRLATKYS